MSRLTVGRQLGLLGREPSFRFLFLATFGSGLGTWLALVALQIDVLHRTHSPLWMSALLIADVLPMPLLALTVAPLVDRLSRKWLMIGADVARLGVFVALPFARSATEIVALAAIAGAATGIFRPAIFAGLPYLVANDDLPVANSLLQAIDNVTWSVGSVAGGALVAASGPHLAYWINAVTFLVSALLLFRIPQRLLQEGRAETRGHWRDLADGFSLVRRSRALLTVLVAWNATMLASAFVNVGEPFLATQSFAAGSFGLGLMMGSAGLGLAGGAFFAGRWIERRGLANVYGASLALMAVGTGAAAAAPDVWVAAACVVVSGAGNGTAVVCNALLVQRGAPDRLRGRAFTMLMSANMVILTLGMVLAGHLTRGVGPRWIWGLAAMLSAASGLVGFALARGVPEHPSAASSADAEQEVLPPAEPAGQTAQRGL